jgi:glycerophosphoryl diester phosphodiesterase
MGPLRRRLNQLGGALLLAILIGVSVAGIYRAFFAPAFPDVENIAHAGGAVDGMVYTNSLRALDESAESGFKFFEIDFVKTSDGFIVCGHDWHAFPAEAPDLAGFLSGRGSLPACTLEELYEWMERHPSAILVSDAKVDTIEVNRQLRERLGNRLVPQAYDAGELQQLLADGSPTAILTLYRLDGLPAMLAEMEAAAAFGDRLAAITMPANVALGGTALWAKFRTNRPVLAHTVNDCTLGRLLVLLGVDGLYTDTLAPGTC